MHELIEFGSHILQDRLTLKVKQWNCHNFTSWITGIKMNTIIEETLANAMDSIFINSCYYSLGLGLFSTLSLLVAPSALLFDKEFALCLPLLLKHLLFSCLFKPLLYSKTNPQYGHVLAWILSGFLWSSWCFLYSLLPYLPWNSFWQIVHILIFDKCVVNAVIDRVWRPHSPGQINTERKAIKLPWLDILDIIYK